MFAIEMVEGKDAPKELPKDPNEKKGKTAALLLRLCQSLFARGTIVILDSGFCVLQALIELRKVGVFASAVIKKRRYWPKHVPGAAMDAYMKEHHQYGECNSLKGSLDGHNYNLFCMRDVKYNMKIMSTYGQLVVEPGFRERYRFWNENGQSHNMTLKYMEPFENHYLYRHAVDDHNNNRHSDISLEETWVTHRWANRVFAFYFVWRRTGSKGMTLLDFRRQFAKELIYNKHYKDDPDDLALRRSKRSRVASEHMMRVAPNFGKKFENGR
jgi:Transposase IS4